MYNIIEALNTHVFHALIFVRSLGRYQNTRSIIIKIVLPNLPIKTLNMNSHNNLTYIFEFKTSGSYWDDFLSSWVKTELTKG